MLTAEQLQARMHGLGGSDIGAVLGLNTYRSAVDVFMEKTGKVLPPDLSDNERVHFGNVLEDVVASEYARRHSVKVRRRNLQFTHKVFPWALANIDRSVDNQQKILECKTADAWTKGNWGPDGSDEVPDSYLVQVAWYMAVLGYSTGDLAVLIGGNDYRTYYFERDAELEGMLFRKSMEFWEQNILSDTPPPPSCDRDLETLYAVDNGTSIVASLKIEGDVEALKHVKEEIKQLTEIKERHEFDIKAFLGEHSEVLLDGSGAKLVTWKAPKPSKRLDGKKLKADAPDLWNNYAIDIQNSRRFLIK